MTLLRPYIITSVFLIMSTVIFNMSCYGCKQSATDKTDSVYTANQRKNVKYQKTGLSASQIISEMQANGWLKKDFSQHFVAPQGKASAEGTIDSPIDLQTALKGGNNSKIKAGDLVWLRGGTYQGSFTVTVKGKANAPIHFRQYLGERAVLDKSAASRQQAALNVRSPYVWFWDFEITNSFPNRRRLNPEGKVKPWRGSGINVWAANTKYINLIIHDNGHGFGLWNEEGGTEIYGCLIFNNGNNKKEHGIYGHNKTGTQTIAKNLIFNNAGYGLHIYANSMKSSSNGFDIKNNTVFNNGSLMFEDQVADQILVGSVRGVSSERILLDGNIVYNFPDAPTSKNRGIRLGYRDQENKDVKVLNNFIVSKVPLKILWWKSVQARGNTIITSGKSVEIKTPAKADISSYQFAANVYLNTKTNNPVFIFNENKINFDEWQRKMKFDSASSNALQVNLNPRIFINLNKYDNSRADVTIYNHNKSKNVSLDLNNFLTRGETFEIRNAQDYFGQPVLSGTYNGLPLQISLKSKNVTAPIGKTEMTPPHTEEDFAVFVVKKT